MSAVTMTDPRPSKRLSSWRISAPVVVRVASVITLLFGIGHTLGALQSWSPPGDTHVLRAMRSFRFDADGASRTYWDFYVGFGLMISVFLCAQAVALWQLSVLTKKDAASAQPILWVFFFSVVANAVLAWMYFFPIPVILAVTIALALGLALAAGGRRPGQR